MANRLYVVAFSYFFIYVLLYQSWYELGNINKGESVGYIDTRLHLIQWYNGVIVRVSDSDAIV